MERMIYVRGVRRFVGPLTYEALCEKAKTARCVVLEHRGTIVLYGNVNITFVSGFTQDELDRFSMFISRPYNLGGEKPSKDVESVSGGIGFFDCRKYHGGL